MPGCVTVCARVYVLGLVSACLWESQPSGEPGTGGADALQSPALVRAEEAGAVVPGPGQGVGRVGKTAIAGQRVLGGSKELLPVSFL